MLRGVEPHCSTFDAPARGRARRASPTAGAREDTLDALILEAVPAVDGKRPVGGVFSDGSQ